MNSAPEKPDNHDQLPTTDAPAAEVAELPKREPNRALTAAAIHAAAEWVVLQDSVPVPTHIDLRAHVISGPMNERLAAVHAISDAFGVPVQQHGTTVWATVEIHAHSGVKIYYSVLASTDMRREAWDGGPASA